MVVREADPTRDPRIDEDNHKFFFPANASPGANCFLYVSVCSTCGWWYSIENADMCNDGYAAIYQGILESFDLTAAQVPIEVLETELPRHVEQIDGVNPQRMEDLIARVLKGVYDCEVRQLGYTRDNGVDLILLNGDKQTAVQVKRRENPSRPESVRGVREFLGACIVRDERDLIYVTNAERYSKDAEQLAQKAVSKEVVDSFDLISRDTLMTLVRAHGAEPYWRSAIQTVRDGSRQMPDVPDPYSFV